MSEYFMRAVGEDGKLHLVGKDQSIEEMKNGAPLLCLTVASDPSIQEREKDRTTIGECSLCKEPIYYRIANESAALKICIGCLHEFTLEALRQQFEEDHE